MAKRLLHVLFVLGLFLAACSSTQPNADGPKTPQALQPTAVSTALFQIVKADGTRFDVTLDALKTLPLAQVTAEGKVEEGPIFVMYWLWQALLNSQKSRLPAVPILLH
ncbi:MAG: hypothetical protein EHM38_09200 [Geobacteraceae bacterium]|nr:MAG: hypothetical protein EHM38_09200 [Geobacteraceae bacterium]